MGLEKQTAVSAGDHSLGPPIASPNLVLQRAVRIRPLPVDEFVAVEEAGDASKSPSSLTEVVGCEGITMPNGFDGPAARATSDPLAAVQSRHGAKKLDAVFDLGETVDDELDRERIGADVFSSAKHLNDVPAVAEEDVLGAVNGLEERPPGREIAERQHAAEARIVDRAGMSTDDTGEVVRSPKHIGVESVVSWIGEKNRVPRLRRGDVVAGPDTTWSRRRDECREVGRAPTAANRGDSLGCASDIPTRGVNASAS